MLSRQLIRFGTDEAGEGRHRVFDALGTAPNFTGELLCEAVDQSVSQFLQFLLQFFFAFAPSRRQNEQSQCGRQHRR